MSEEKKVIEFPTEENVDQSTENVSDNSIDTSDPLSDENIKSVKGTIKSLMQTVQVIQNIWIDTKNQYQLTSEQMYKLHKFNQDHLNPRSEKEDEEWDEFNGICKLQVSDAKEIFGDNHHFTKSVSVGMDGILDIIKDAFADYINYIRFTKELQDTDIAYRKLLDMREERDMLTLAAVIKKEEDPEKKSAMQKSIDQYFNVKFLGYLSDPLPDTEKKMLVDAFGDVKKIEYYLNRSRDKLTQMGMSQTFILEVSNLEKIHLPERYHMLSNMTLLYFMRAIIHTDVADNISKSKKYERDKIVAMINALDIIIRKTGTVESIQKIKDNIMAFLDQLIDDVYAKYYPDKEILPLQNITNAKETEETES